MPAQAELFYFGLTGTCNVAQFKKTEYRSARVTIQASSGAEHQLSEVYVIHDNDNAYLRQLDFIYTIDPYVSYTAQIDSNNVYIQANTSLSNTDLVIYADLFDNPVSSSDKNIDLEKIIESTTSIASLLPDDKTDYVSMVTSSLNKGQELGDINKQINDALVYMQSASFLAQSASFQAGYINSLADSINSKSNTLNNTVQSDVQSFYDISKKIESVSTLTNLNLGYTNDNTKGLLDKILNANNKSLFGGNK